jgi:hypothetical protein
LSFSGRVGEGEGEGGKWAKEGVKKGAYGVERGDWTERVREYIGRVGEETKVKRGARGY